MAITEQDRHRSHLRLEEVLGSEHAAALTEHLRQLGDGLQVAFAFAFFAAAKLA
ncbi:MAG: hypothetical protein JWO68_3051 [Actinomycetia bacterium]|nr:hypothetical protein [Actinomycetes bacterium]